MLERTFWYGRVGLSSLNRLILLWPARIVGTADLPDCVEVLLPGLSRGFGEFHQQLLTGPIRRRPFEQHSSWLQDETICLRPDVCVRGRGL